VPGAVRRRTWGPGRRHTQEGRQPGRRRTLVPAAALHDCEVIAPLVAPASSLELRISIAIPVL